ncbi:MAG: RNA polymerase subunit sigma-24, partial [Solirubrobacterales bacterium]
VPALARALHGAERVAGTLANWTRQGARGGGQMRRATVNRLPGALMFDADGGLIGAMSLEIAGEEIVAVNSIVNPDKLRHLGPVGDMLALLRQKP